MLPYRPGFPRKTRSVFRLRRTDPQSLSSLGVHKHPAHFFDHSRRRSQSRSPVQRSDCFRRNNLSSRTGYWFPPPAYRSSLSRRKTRIGLLAPVGDYFRRNNPLPKQEAGQCGTVGFPAWTTFPKKHPLYQETNRVPLVVPVQDYSRRNSGESMSVRTSRSRCWIPALVYIAVCPGPFSNEDWCSPAEAFEYPTLLLSGP